MNKNLIASESITIKASAEKVWTVLTTPDKIKEYLFGTQTITDWKAGSPIVFQGEYDGHQYKDRGNVLENKPFETLSYNYWSGFSGLEDKPENYSIIIYKITPAVPGTIDFSWIQMGFANEQGQQHTQNGLKGILEKIKSLAEDDKI